MALINNLAPTTELEAVNAMLSAIGEAPIEDLATASREDVDKALNILREAAREVQARGWRFNTEFNFKLAPTDTVLIDGTAYNVFTPPADLAAFRLSLRSEQYGMDAVVRPSRTYVDVNGAAVDVLYDRINGRDGFTNAELYIDPTWFLDFADLPESARRYITVLSARRFSQDQGSEAAAKFGENDEQYALQLLLLDQKEGQAQAAPVSAQTSELDALNQVLSNCGKDEVASLSTLDKTAVRALNTLRRVSREVQSEGWKYNTDLGLKLDPSDTLVVDATLTLNIFTPPSADMISWELTNVTAQDDLIVALRPPKVYVGAAQVFYDRRFNRDGFDSTKVTELLINAVYFFDFADMPDTVRRFIVALASKQYADSLPDVDSRVTDDDVIRAWRLVQKDQRDYQRHSFLDSRLSLEILGGRPPTHLPNRQFTTER